MLGSSVSLGAAELAKDGVFGHYSFFIVREWFAKQWPGDKTWAYSLAHGILLPEDVHAFEEGTEESMGRRLQWHIIVVIFHLLISY